MERGEGRERKWKNRKDLYGNSCYIWGNKILLLLSKMSRMVVNHDVESRFDFIPFLLLGWPKNLFGF